MCGAEWRTEKPPRSNQPNPCLDTNKCFSLLDKFLATSKFASIKSPFIQLRNSFQPDFSVVNISSVKTLFAPVQETRI